MSEKPEYKTPPTVSNLVEVENFGRKRLYRYLSIVVLDRFPSGTPKNCRVMLTDHEDRAMLRQEFGGFDMIHMLIAEEFVKDV